MKCKYCKKELKETVIKTMLVGFCYKEWQINPKSLRPNVRNSPWIKEKSSK